MTRRKHKPRNQAPRYTPALDTITSSTQNRAGGKEKSQSKSSYSAYQLAGATLIAGYFIAMNVMEIAIINYVEQADPSSDPSRLEFVIGFYLWKAKSSLLQLISKVGIVVGPIILFSSLKEGIWDAIIRRKSASFIRHSIDFLSSLLLLSYIAIMIVTNPLEGIISSASLSDVEGPQAVIHQTLLSTLYRLLYVQYIALFINVLSGVLPILKYRDSVTPKHPSLLKKEL